MTNTEDLSFLYRKISVLEMFEKLKSCSGDWVQISPTQFKVSVNQNNEVWDIVLSRNPLAEKIVMDFSKNSSYFYSISSDDEANLVAFYQEIEGDDGFEKDKEILRDVSAFEGC
jgi:hypothetical protein